MKQKTNKHLIEGIIGLVLILLLGWLIMRGRNASAPSENVVPNNEQSEINNNTPANNTPATNQLASTDSVAVSTQSSNSKAVTIDNINLSKPGFAVVGTLGSNGKLSQIIGSSRLVTPGEKQDLEVLVTSALSEKTSYMVMLYQDNGDKKFDPKTDTLLTGKTATATFSAK